MSRRTLFLLAFGLTAALVLFPIRTTVVRLAILLGGAASIALWGWMLEARGRLVLAGVLVLVAGLFALPAKPLASAPLRSAYLDAVQARSRAVYVWGGETHLGIDCSGLVRLPLASALAWEGLRGLNGGAIRRAARLWWTDASAAELGRGFGGRARLVGEYRDARQVDERVRPGDFAITADGKHAMVYTAAHTWTEADPGQGRVVVLDAEQDISGWLFVPIRVFRWSVLD